MDCSFFLYETGPGSVIQDGKMVKIRIESMRVWKARGKEKLFFFCLWRLKKKPKMAIRCHRIWDLRRPPESTSNNLPSSLPISLFDEMIGTGSRIKKDEMTNVVWNKDHSYRVPGNANPMRCRWLKSNQTIFSFSFLSIASLFCYSHSLIL